MKKKNNIVTIKIYLNEISLFVKISEKVVAGYRKYSLDETESILSLQ